VRDLLATEASAYDALAFLSCWRLAMRCTPLLAHGVEYLRMWIESVWMLKQVRDLKALDLAASGKIRCAVV